MTGASQYVAISVSQKENIRLGSQMYAVLAIWENMVFLDKSISCIRMEYPLDTLGVYSEINSRDHSYAPLRSRDCQSDAWFHERDRY